MKFNKYVLSIIDFSEGSFIEFESNQTKAQIWNEILAHWVRAGRHDTIDLSYLNGRLHKGKGVSFELFTLEEFFDKVSSRDCSRAVNKYVVESEFEREDKLNFDY